MYKYIDYYNQKKYVSLKEKAYDILEEMIITLELEPGEMYSESDLSNATGIGRTPVREAIKKLEETKLIKIIPRNGIYITPITFEECSLQMEVRVMLEKLIATRAAKFSTPNEREKFADLAERYKKSTEQDNALESIRIDNEFNHYLAKCARNIFATGALMPLQPMARRIYFSQYHINKKLIQEINQSHIDTMMAIIEGDEEKVISVIDNLISNVKKLTILHENLYINL